MTAYHIVYYNAEGKSVATQTLETDVHKLGAAKMMLKQSTLRSNEWSYFTFTEVSK